LWPPALAFEEYDPLIVGDGSAAFAAAITAAELGAKVWLIEAATLGGTCVNVGCVPSKTLIKAAELCYRSRAPDPNCDPVH
jgi:mercuric reductase